MTTAPRAACGLKEGPQHHLNCDTLVRFTSGELSEGMRVFAASHIALCPRCRRHLLACENEAGKALESLPPVPMADSCLKQLLKEIDSAQTTFCIDVTAPPDMVPDTRFPEVLRCFVGQNGEQVVWKNFEKRTEGRVNAWEKDHMDLYFLQLECGWKIDAKFFPKNAWVMVLDGEIKSMGQNCKRGDVLCCHHFCLLSTRAEQNTLCLIGIPTKTDRPGLLQRLVGFLCGEVE